MCHVYYILLMFWLTRKKKNFLNISKVTKLLQDYNRGSKVLGAAIKSTLPNNFKKAKAKKCKNLFSVFDSSSSIFKCGEAVRS